MFNILILLWREESRKQKPRIKAMLTLKSHIFLQSFKTVFALIYSYLLDHRITNFVKSLLPMSISVLLIVVQIV